MTDAALVIHNLFETAKTSVTSDERLFTANGRDVNTGRRNHRYINIIIILL